MTTPFDPGPKPGHGSALRVTLGMPLHNASPYLRQAIEALLQQTYRDFRLVVFDDGSTDDSYSIASEYARNDERIRLHRADARSGLIEAWASTARIAGEDEPPDWFGWYADHDWVEPDWLERLLETAGSRPSAVLVHARTVHAGPDGALTGDDSFPLDTGGQDRYERIRTLTLGRIAAGDTVYGLMRYDALRACGYFPMEIMPDRLLVSELSLFGDIVCASRALRYRRVSAAGAAANDPVSRQMLTLFRPGEAPVAPYLSHVTYFLRCFLASRPAQASGTAARLYHALTYFYRHFNRFKAQCEAELAMQSAPSYLHEVVEFAAQASGGNLKVLYREHAAFLEKLRSSRNRLQSFKRAYRDMHRRFTDQAERIAQERNALDAQAQALREELANARGAVEALRTQLRELERELAQSREAHAVTMEKMRRLEEEKSHLEAALNRPLRTLWKLALRR